MAPAKEYVFFVGAGLTRSIIGIAPTGPDFFAKCFAVGSPYVQDPRIARVGRFIERSFYPVTWGIFPRLEDVLALLDDSIRSKQPVLPEVPPDAARVVLNDLVYLMGKVLKTSLDEVPGGSVQKVLARDLVLKIKGLQQNPETRATIVTPNYDTILDIAMIEAALGCDYGVRLRSQLVWGPYTGGPVPRPQGTERWRYQDAADGPINQGGMPLLKLHGSLNWLSCPKCGEIDAAIGERGAADPSAEAGRNRCVSPYCTESYEPVILPPGAPWSANRFLRQVWEAAEGALCAADGIVFVGYSLPEGDHHIRSLIRRAVARSRKKPRFILVERHPQTVPDSQWTMAVQQRYEVAFGKNAVAFQAVGVQGLLARWAEIIG